MASDNTVEKCEYRTKTCRWLFYLSLFPLLMCFIVPAILFPGPSLFTIEVLIAMTIGLLFGLYLMGVSIYGIFVDKSRLRLYMSIVVLVSLWTLWSVISWSHIEKMRYLT